jgi:diacylglycerol kinase (ATP)
MSTEPEAGLPEADLHLVVNPERSDVAEEVTDLATEVERPATADGLEASAREAAADAAVDVVGAVGGDGTQRTVAEALSGTGTPLLVVPAGTVNLLGRIHGIRSVGDARRALTDGEDRRLDLGRCDGEPFLLNASTGYDAEVIAGVDDRAKRFGRLGYAAVGVRRLIGAEARRCRVTVDDEPAFDDLALTVLVMNVAARGSERFELAPGAAPDDGRLHVVIIRSRRALARAGWARIRGRTPREEDLVVVAGTRIDVEWDVDVASQRDGDPAGTGRRFHYEVEPGAVVLRVPR